MNKRWLGITAAFLILVIPFIMMLTNPNIETSRSLCPFKMMTGLPCPACGLTKSMICFYRGDILKSLHYHIFGPLVIFFCTALILIFTTELFTKRRYFRKILYSRKIAYITIVFLLLYHLIRLIWFIHTHNFSQIMAQTVWH